MIGLKRHSVVLSEHHREWARIFVGEAESLRASLGEMAIAIEHIGSTAVPALPAKPIIDIGVAVSSLELIPAISAKLSEIQYLDRGDSGENGGYLFLKESSPDVRIIHLHVVAETDPQWHRYLACRNLLRSDPELRERYASLKRSLAIIYPNDRKTYTACKSEIIKNLLCGERQPDTTLNGMG